MSDLASVQHSEALKSDVKCQGNEIPMDECMHGRIF